LRIDVATIPPLRAVNARRSGRDDIRSGVGQDAKIEGSSFASVGMTTGDAEIWFSRRRRRCACSARG
jgi:hypothetical protein